jgi:hypothetical protein
MSAIAAWSQFAAQHLIVNKGSCMLPTSAMHNTIIYAMFILFETVLNDM